MNARRMSWFERKIKNKVHFTYTCPIQLWGRWSTSGVDPLALFPESVWPLFVVSDKLMRKKYCSLWERFFSTKLLFDLYFWFLIHIKRFSQIPKPMSNQIIWLFPAWKLRLSRHVVSDLVWKLWLNLTLELLPFYDAFILFRLKQCQLNLFYPWKVWNVTLTVALKFGCKKAVK